MDRIFYYYPKGLQELLLQQDDPERFPFNPQQKGGTELEDTSTTNDSHNVSKGGISNELPYERTNEIRPKCVELPVEFYLFDKTYFPKV